MPNKKTERNATGGLVGLIIFLIIGFWVWNHWINPTKWTAFYYYDLGNYDNYKKQEVESLEKCREWIKSVAVGRFTENYDYECGTNCRIELDGIGTGYNRCDENFQ